jgi:hypothetical protein
VGAISRFVGPLNNRSRRLVASRLKPKRASRKDAPWRPSTRSISRGRNVLVLNCGKLVDRVTCSPFSASERPAFGAAWKCSGGSHHLSRIRQESGNRRRFCAQSGRLMSTRSQITRRSESLRQAAREKEKANPIGLFANEGTDFDKGEKSRA